MHNGGLDANYIATLRAHTRDVLAHPSLGITPLDIISIWTQCDIAWTPGCDIHAFARRFGAQGSAVLAVLETWQEVVNAPASTGPAPAAPVPRARPRRRHTKGSQSIPPPLPIAAAQAPGPEMLCACSGKLPKHAVLGEDGRLYDRDAVTSQHPQLHIRADHTMTGALNAWREHANAASTQRVAAMIEAVLCPITMEVPKSPVLAADGYTYERHAIETHLRRKGAAACSPMHGLKMESHALVESASLKRLIADQQIADASN